MPYTEDTKREYVHGLFGRISGRYDLMNTLISFGLHRRWRRACVRLAGGLPEGGAGLDLCCGTGDFIAEMLRSCSGDCTVTGVDFSSEMLTLARNRFRRELEAGSVKLHEADVTGLSFLPEYSFDLATIGFGLRSVTDINAVLSGIHRALKPGGTFVNLDLTHPVPPLVSPFSSLWLSVGVPLLGRMVFGAPNEYAWLGLSLASFPSRNELSEMLRSAGFTNARAIPFGLGAVSAHFSRKPL
jgi:demethylmenaquinone methyltransferase/2-methoxy-6-polyprenyl-1,4-benzoquinol methylase